MSSLCFPLPSFKRGACRRYEDCRFNANDVRYIKAPDVLSEFFALHIPPSDLAGFFARRIGGQHEEPWLGILLCGPEAVGLNPEERKAAEMTGINLIHVEIERLFGAQFVHAKFKSSHCHLLLHRLGLRIYWSFNQLTVAIFRVPAMPVFSEAYIRCACAFTGVRV